MNKPETNDKARGTGQTRREFTRKLVVAGAGIPLVGSLIPANAMNSAPDLSVRNGAEPWKIHLFSKHL